MEPSTPYLTLSTSRATRKLKTAVLLISIITAILFLISIPISYEYIKNQCINSVCDGFYNPPPGAKWLSGQGITAGMYSAAYVSIYVIFGLVYILAAAMLFWKKSADTIGLLSTVMLASLGGTFTPIMGALMTYNPLLSSLVHLIEAGGMAAFILFFFLFPNGRFIPKWSIFLCFFIIVLRIPGMIFPNTFVDLQVYPKWIFIIWFCMWIGSLISVQIYRYKYVMNPLERQQAKWAVFGMVLALICLFSQTAIYIVFEKSLLADPFKMYYLEIGIHTCMLLIPIALLMAILKHRLWDIDLIVSRTLTYGVMTVFTVTVYIVGVWYTGLLFQTNNHLVSSLVATGIVAVLFAPLKERVQRIINRVIYGENDNPYSVLFRLAKELEVPMSPKEVLQLVVKNIRDALKLPYASISFIQNGESVLVAEIGQMNENMYEFSLINRGEELGILNLSARSPGESFSKSDQKFLDMIVRQASVIVQSAKVSMDLKLLAVDLQESRENLVLAREEERRKLRSNLHDDLAPRLAALALTTAAAEDLVESNPSITREILHELRSTIRQTVSEIRSLVYDLRPPTLDEMGLVGAIHERMKELSIPNEYNSGISFSLHVPEKMTSLPAAVEVAAYRIMTEAMVNVVRHSKAKACSIYISQKVNGLEILITDDGHGIQVSEDKKRNSGIGMVSMRERASELGGSFQMVTGPNLGTKITVFLPIISDKVGENDEETKNTIGG